MKISDLKPTESRLLLDPYNISGRELIISAIGELLFFGMIRIKEYQIESIDCQVVELGIQPEHSKLNSYQKVILKCSREHYKHFPEPLDEVTTLTPIKLLRSVYAKSNFSYPNFKKDHIIANLQKNKLFKSTFPFYYFKSIRTKIGERLVERLKNQIKELENHYTYYKDNEPDKLKNILEDLGPNILLAYNINTVSKQLNIWKSEGFFNSTGLLMFDPLMTGTFSEFEMPDLEMPSFEVPPFELPDIAIDIPFFGDN